MSFLPSCRTGVILAEIGWNMARHKETNTQDFRSAYFNLFLIILPNTSIIPYTPLYDTSLSGLPVLKLTYPHFTLILTFHFRFIRLLLLVMIPLSTTVWDSSRFIIMALHCSKASNTDPKTCILDAMKRERQHWWLPFTPPITPTNKPSLLLTESVKVARCILAVTWHS